MRDRIISDPTHYERRIASNDEVRAIAEAMFEQGLRPPPGKMLGDAEHQLHRVRALYSMGASIDEVRSEYESLPQLFSQEVDLTPEELFNPAMVGGGFNDFLWVTALSVLFEDERGASLLAGAVERFGMTDFFVDSFIGSMIPFRDPSQTLQLEIISKFHGVDPVLRPHEPLKALAERAAIDPEAASDALTKYASKDWYRLHSWTGWYNKHKAPSAERVYSGYWCFECAAVAKVFNIDDAKLESSKYYPWDLAHF